MRVKPYLAAVVSVALALLVRLALEPVLQERSPLLLFTLAVTMAAYYGGRKAGLLATILSALAGDYFFVSLTDRSEQVRVALFVGIGTSISLLSGAMYRAKSRARQELARRVAAEESERQQRSQQEQVFEQAGFGIAIVDPEAKRLLFVNPAFARMHGYTPEELAGRSPAETLAPEALEKLPQRVEETHREGHGAFESAHLRKDGSAFPVMVHVTAVKDSQGRVLHRIVYVQDISLQKEQQKQLQQAEAAFRQAQKMESLGILAGGIAHDFNNLLTAMIGNASLIWEELPPGSALQEPVERMLDASERMAKLTNQMLAYSGRGKFVVERLDVSK
ncbi:MAG: PAS domain S-box protein, partial [Acidobacteria bacterium]|nr:PAS domain S-box protein [Acidobacteriota bacterium]